MKKSLIAFAVLAAAALSLFAFLRGTKAETPVVPRRRPSAEKRAAYLPRDAVRAARISPASAAGDRRRYRVRYEYAVDVDMGAGGNGLVLEADGELTVRSFEPGLVGMRFAPLRLSSRGRDGGSAGDFDSVRPEVEAELLVRRDARGRAVSLRFATETSEGARNILRGLVAALEVVGPDEPAARWTARGADTTGRYIAEYAVLGEGADGVRLSRRKTYEEVTVVGLPPTEEKPFDVGTGGETVILLDPTGGLVTLEGRESLRLAGRAGEISVDVRAESSIRVTLLEFTTGDPDVLASADDARRREAALPRHDGFQPERMGAPRTSVRPGAVSEILTGLAATKDWSKEAPHAFLALREIFAESAEARAMAAAILRKGELSPEVLQTLADALGAAPEGWRELLPMAQDGSLAALSALGLTPSPTDEVIRLLATKARDGETAEVAIDSLGLAAGLPGNRDRRDAIAGEIAGLLGQGRDAHVLRALGNSGAPGAEAAILDKAGSPDEEVRSAAAVALRKYASKEAFDAIVRLAGDPSGDVRETAVSVLAGRADPGVQAVLAKAAKSDPHDGVRIEALRWFAMRGDRDTLLHAAANDPSKAVQTFAKGELQR